MSRNDRSGGGVFGWLLPIILLFVFTPAGVLLLVLKVLALMDRSARAPGNGAVKRHPYDLERAGEAAPQPEPAEAPPRQEGAGGRSKDPIPTGKPAIPLGGVLTAVFGLASVSAVAEALMWLPEFPGYFLEDTVPMLSFLAAAVALLLYGLRQKKKGLRFRKYLNLIGRREQVSLTAISQAGGVDRRVLCADLQEMLDRGVLPAGYLDLRSDRLVLNGEGVSDPIPAPEPEPEPERPADPDRAEAILREIRQVNDDIAHPRLSAQIDEIEEITRKIFQQLEADPSREPELRSFLNYYLPTTLKILHAYARLESQGIEGENITAAKARIEGMMDKVVEGFEKQLDQLFAHDAMDITTDVEVLERMLSKDGLAGGSGLRLGG